MPRAPFKSYVPFGPNATKEELVQVIQNQDRRIRSLERDLNYKDKSNQWLAQCLASYSKIIGPFYYRS